MYKNILNKLQINISDTYKHVLPATWNFLKATVLDRVIIGFVFGDNKLLKTLENLRKSFPSTFKRAMGQTFLTFDGRGDFVLGIKPSIA